MLTIYVENKHGVAEDYRITEGAIRRALSSAVSDIDIRVHTSSEPDPVGLANAQFFIGSGFDTERIGRTGRNLRVVHCTSAGVDRYLPLDWLPEGSMLTNSSGVHAEKGGAFGAMAVLLSASSARANTIPWLMKCFDPKHTREHCRQCTFLS